MASSNRSVLRMRPAIAHREAAMACVKAAASLDRVGAWVECRVRIDFTFAQQADSHRTTRRWKRHVIIQQSLDQQHAAVAQLAEQFDPQHPYSLLAQDLIRPSHCLPPRHEHLHTHWFMNFATSRFALRQRAKAIRYEGRYVIYASASMRVGRGA